MSSNIPFTLKSASFVEINRDTISLLAGGREDENDSFRLFLKNMDGREVDILVHQINDRISSQIDCTRCGACCKTLMINVTEAEKESLAAHMQITAQQFKDDYLEESAEGQMIMHSIPCSFLSGNKCSVYKHRFEECREFPHLHKDNFKGRLFGTLMHYGKCPIIYNVVEELKTETGFRIPDTGYGIRDTRC